MKEASYEFKVDLIKEWIGTGTVNIFGRPFSGKDTHGAELAKMLGCPLIGGGEILRSHTDESIKSHIATGALAPTDEYLRIVLPFLAQDKYAKTPLILSSVGRWQGEEKSVIEAAKESGHSIMAAIYLDVSENTAKDRWLASERERHDDKTEDILLKRMDEFHDKTVPVLETYEKLGLLITIDGNPTIEEVRMEIIDALFERAQKYKSSL